MRAIRVHQPGGPEVLKLEEVPAPRPGPGDAVVRHEAIGVNYIDVYHRSGLYPVTIPFTPGMEAAGVVEAVGAEVIDVRAGDRVAYAMGLGAYAERSAVAAWKLAPIPPDIPANTAAAIMLQGMTAHYLAFDAFPLKPGSAALIHAAAGGVGLLLVQVAKRLGATVFGTVSNEEKAKLAREAGADHVILYSQADFESEVKSRTAGRGVDVVYDSVGAATFDKSLNCLRPRGTLVLFGQSSGKVPPVDLWVLQAKGSLYLTRPTLAHYASNAAEVRRRSGDLFAWIRKGELRVRIHATYPLADAQKAHRDLEGRRTSGKLLLVP